MRRTRIIASNERSSPGYFVGAAFSRVRMTRVLSTGEAGGAWLVRPTTIHVAANGQYWTVVALVETAVLGAARAALSFE